MRESKTIVGKWRSRASKFNVFLLQNFKLSALLWPIYHFPSPPQCPGQDLVLAEDRYNLCWLHLTQCLDNGRHLIHVVKSQCSFYGLALLNCISKVWNTWHMIWGCILTPSPYPLSISTSQNLYRASSIIGFNKRNNQNFISGSIRNRKVCTMLLPTGLFWSLAQGRHSCPMETVGGYMVHRESLPDTHQQLSIMLLGRMALL